MKKNSQLRKLTLAGLMVAAGYILSALYIPIGGSKVFPIQHLLNVLSACMLGPAYAVMNAFVISLLRNLMGTGTLLAFPGSMIGALISSIVYMRTKSYRLTALGEFIGTGIIGAIVAVPIARILLGKMASIFFFIIPFSSSALLGALIALVLLDASNVLKVKVQERQYEK